MNNSENKDILDNTISDEASARAEKIRAIRESLRNADENNGVQAEQASAANAAAMGIPAANAVDRSAQTEMLSKKKRGKKKKKKTLKQKIRGLFPEKGDSAAEVIRKIVFLISIIAIIVCGYLVADYYLDLWRSRAQYSDLAGMYETYEPIIEDVPIEIPAEEPKEKVYSMLDGARKLLDINPDTVGYLRIPTKNGGDPIIDLPVVQAEDNMKYLDLNFKGEDSRTGTLFLDFRNHFDEVENGRLKQENSDNLVIYGHNMADESMFGKLKYYYSDADFYKKHPIVQFNSNYETYYFKIFAIFIVDAKDESETKYDCWNQLSLDGEEAFYNFVNEAKRRTIYNNDIDVKYGDRLLTLSTCHYLLQDRSRLMIMARSVRPGEGLYTNTDTSKKNKNIKWPSMYYNTKTDEKYNDKAIFVPYGPEEAVKEAEAALAAEKKKKEEERKRKEAEKKKKEEAAKSTGASKSKTTVKSKSASKTTAKTKTTAAAKTKTAAEG